MGMFAEFKGEQFKKCPKCGERASWQSKRIWLTYKDMEIFLGDHGLIELDENMNGSVMAYCYNFPPNLTGCGKTTEFEIKNGKLEEVILSSSPNH